MEDHREERSKIDLAELERIKFSHELHDGVLQWIVGAKMQAEALSARCQQGDAVSQAEIQHLFELLSKAVAEGRQLIAGTRPLDDETSWHRAIIDWAMIARAGVQTRIEFQLDESTESVPDTLGQSLYRIAQESIGNALRYAQADLIQVTSSKIDEHITLVVRDDGCGFEVDSIDPGHYGIQGICERTQLLDGQSQIDSAPGHGTTVTVTIPL